MAEKTENGDIPYVDALVFMRLNRYQLEDALKLIKQWESENFDEIAQDAANYPDGHRGMLFEVRNGRKTYSYDGIEEVENAETALKEAKEKYKSMFIAKQKGAAYANVGEDGEELKMPEIKYGAGSIVVKPMKR